MAGLNYFDLLQTKFTNKLSQDILQQDCFLGKEETQNQGNDSGANSLTVHT